MTQPLVSAIIPTYRRPGLVAKSCRSVFAQSWRPLELIVIDDGSGDETPQVLEALRPEAEAAGVALHVRTVINGGPGLARNAAMEMAQGEFFAFLDDDDLWKPHKLTTQVAAMLQRPEAGASFTQFVHESSEDRPKPGPGQLADGWVFDSICRGLTRVHLQTLMIRRSAWQAVGGFAALFNFEDSEFALRLALQFPFVAVPQPLTVICTPAGGTVSRDAGLEGDLKRDRLKLDVLAEFARKHAGSARFSTTALNALRARVHDEHIKHLIWLGRVAQARQAWKTAMSECGNDERLAALKGKLARARLAGWFGLRLKKP